MKFPKLGACLISLCVSALLNAAEQNPIQQLDWLIGSWDFEDVQVEGEYRETGIRTCSYVLNEQYILCESQGVTNKGKKRTALMYFNFNHMDNRFEMTALFADFPRKNLYTIELSEAGHELSLINESWTEEGITRNHLATISYNGTDQYVWNLLNGEADPETGMRVAGFRDTVTRRD